jgi:O-antigen ligase
VLSTKQSYLKWGLIVVIAVGGLMVMGFNGRMRNSLNDVKGFFSESSQNIDTENRLIVWYNTLDLVKSNLITGVGIGDNKDKLIEMYKERGFKKAEEAQLNIHNQFIETTIQLGLMGLLALLLLFLLPFIRAVRARNILLICFLVISALFFMFESCLNRQAGVFYFAFMLSVLIFIRPIDNKEIISSAP